jgi:hypothetical protein
MGRYATPPGSAPTIPPRLRELLSGALYLLPLIGVVGWYAWLSISADAEDDENECAATVAAMKATPEDVRPMPPGGWPDGARVDLSSRYPYLANVLEGAGCLETLAKLRRGERLVATWPASFNR